MYVLETAGLNIAQKKKLDAFQQKGLRKKRKLAPTFINRANTNEYVLDLANSIVPEIDNGQAYRNLKRSEGEMHVLKSQHFPLGSWTELQK